MASILDLKRRIRSVKNTRQITKAMKMVSAAKLRRAQEQMTASRPYSAMLASVLESMKRRVETYDQETRKLRHPLLAERLEKKLALIVITGDKGFAGAFNTNVIRAASQFILENDRKQIDIEPVGRKAREFFRRNYPVSLSIESGGAGRRHGRQRRAGIEVTGDHPGMLEQLNFTEVRDLADDLANRYSIEEVDAVYMVYNEFKSVIQQRIVVERILPVIEIGRQEITSAEEMTQEARERAALAATSAGLSVYPTEAEVSQKQFEEERERFGTQSVDFIYEESPEDVLRFLMPQYVASQMYHAMRESVAAEHAARMTAMDAATNNASDMIDDLTLTMNRVRQAAITKEIIEIVSGAAAIG